jgi:hypothetical protein
MTTAQGTQTVQAGAKPVVKSSVPAVLVWAAIGAVLLGVEAFFVITWIIGPGFTPVHSGPDVPPAWMRVALITGQVLFVAGARSSCTGS